MTTNAPGSLYVFISYRRGDSGPYARNIYEALTQHFGDGHVFYDVDGIEPGVDFVDVLDESLRRTDVLLALIGPSWLDATDEDGQRRLDDPHDYVRLEVEAALSKKVRVIPLLIAGAKMPQARNLPESMQPPRRNAASLSDDHWLATRAELIETLERVSAELATSTPADGPWFQHRTRPRHQPTFPMSRRRTPSTWPSSTPRLLQSMTPVITHEATAQERPSIPETATTVEAAPSAAPRRSKRRRPAMYGAPVALLAVAVFVAVLAVIHRSGSSSQNVDEQVLLNDVGPSIRSSCA